MTNSLTTAHVLKKLFEATALLGVVYHTVLLTSVWVTLYFWSISILTLVKHLVSTVSKSKGQKLHEIDKWKSEKV